MAAVLATWALSCASGDDSPDRQLDASQATEEAESTLELVPAFGEAMFAEPTDVDPLPGDEDAYFVVEKAGIVKVVSSTGEQRVVADLTDRVNDEGGAWLAQSRHRSRL